MKYNETETRLLSFFNLEKMEKEEFHGSFDVTDFSDYKTTYNIAFKDGYCYSILPNTKEER